MRVSLAQTGHWIRGLGRVANGLACPDPGVGRRARPAGGKRLRLRPAHHRAPRRDAGRNAGALGAAVGAARHARAGVAAAERANGTSPSSLAAGALPPAASRRPRCRSSCATPVRTKRSSFVRSSSEQRQEARDRRRHRDLGGARRAVLAFERDAEALLGQRAAEHAFGAGLHQHACAEQRHDLGAEASGARHVVRLRRAGRAQPRRRLRALVAEAMPGAEARERMRRAPSAAPRRSGSSSRRCRIGLPTSPTPVRLSSAARTSRCTVWLRRDIAAMIDAGRAGDADEARMLARAIVVQRRRRAAGARQRLARSLMRGPMRAAFERRRRRARRAPACGSRPRHAPARRHGWRRRARVPRRRSRTCPPRRSRSAAAPGSPSRPSADRPAASRRRAPAPSRRRHPPPRRRRGGGSRPRRRG